MVAIALHNTRCVPLALVASILAMTAALETSHVAYAQEVDLTDPELIEEGRRLFLEETFGGNGRTCGTCHPPSNNFTIDAAFIRTFRGNDPLFVAQPSGPQLSALEVRKLMQTSALILENLDGFDQPGVLRSVPHTLALGTSGPRFGWSGDGSPGDGSLRSFAIGAVIQHFPKSLNRVENVDFRLPTDDELDALEAFQLSLGRQSDSLGELVGREGDVLLAALDFTDDTVQLGKARFIESPTRNPERTRGCNGCHANGGTNDRQRDTGVALLPSAPACGLGFAAPGDGGEGRDEVETVARAELCGRGPRGGPHATVTFQGNGLFNTPTVIEAADTPPFFHNNAVATLEEAVAFYTSDTFHDSPDGDNRGFVLTTDEVNAIAAFLRALNALENIRSSNAYAEQVLDQELERAADSLRLSIAETTDAIEVLTGGPVQLYAGTDVLPLLQEARELEQSALTFGLPGGLIEEAIGLKEDARDLMVVVEP